MGWGREGGGINSGNQTYAKQHACYFLGGSGGACPPLENRLNLDVILAKIVLF